MMDFLKATPKTRVVKIKKGKKVVIYSNPHIYLKTIFYFSEMMIGLCLIYLIYLYAPLAGTLTNYAMTKKNKAELSLEEKNEIAQPAKTIKEETKQVPDRFKIDIPKIKADTWVVTNVPTDDVSEYNKILSDNVIAHAKGSGLPGGGMGSSVYMFAHSSQPVASAVRSNPVFYLLGEMKNEDKIIVDYNGEKYVYKVYDRKVISPTEVEYLNYSDPSREVAILQTCWPIGTNWKRLLVFGELIKEE